MESPASRVVTPGELRACLDRHGLHLSRDRGQNFLIDDAVADRLVRLAGVEPGDAVVEVGTGLGVLTRALARRGARVTTVEIDGGLVRALRAEALLPEDCTLLHEDALRLDWEALLASLPTPPRIVANLPYSAATPLLRQLLDFRTRVLDWSVMVQRELSLRLTAGVGDDGYGSFAVLHHWCVRAETRGQIAPQLFFPMPKVDSSFVQLVPRADCALAEGELARLEPWLRAAFAKRRKTLANSVSGSSPVERKTVEAALDALGLDLRVRAEALPPETHLALARRLAD